MNPLWKVYKSKVLQTLNPDMEEDMVEEVNPLSNTKHSTWAEHAFEKISRL